MILKTTAPACRFCRSHVREQQPAATNHTTHLQILILESNALKGTIPITGSCAYCSSELGALNLFASHKHARPENPFARFSKICNRCHPQDSKRIQLAALSCSQFIFSKRLAVGKLARLAHLYKPFARWPRRR